MKSGVFQYLLLLFCCLLSYGAGYLVGMTGRSPVTFVMGLLVWGPLTGLFIGAVIIGVLELRRRWWD